MEVSIINGSPRTNGATAILLKEIHKSLTDEYGVAVNYFELSKLNIEYCKGCEICYQTGECCIKTDDFEKIANQIKNSDGIIIGSPTHGSNISAYLKNFMDRGHFIVEQALYNKKCFSLITYEIADGSSALKILNKFFIVSGGTIKNNFLLKIGFNQNPIENRKTVKLLHKQVNKYYNAITAKRKKSIFEFIFNDLIVVNIIWKRYFKRHPQQYGGIIKSYKDKGIHPCLSR